MEPTTTDDDDVQQPAATTCEAQHESCKYTYLLRDALFVLACLAVCSVAGAIVLALCATALLFRALNLARNHNSTSTALTPATCNKFEEIWLAYPHNSFPPSTVSDWLYLPGEIVVHWHHIHVPRAGGSSSVGRSSMVLIHGAGSSAALAWSSVADQLSVDYDLYALDLPAFGRSTVPWHRFTAALHKQVQDMYADCIADYIDAMRLTKPV